MSGKNYERVIKVDLNDDNSITFSVRLEYYYDPGRTWGDPEMCYPPEMEEVDSEVTTIYLYGKEVEDTDLFTHILNSIDEGWLIDKAWSEILL